MKKVIIVVAALLLANNVFAYEKCKDKEARIEGEIAYAKEHNNKHKLRGLEKALEEVKDNCTDASLANKHDEKLADAKEDVREAEYDLAKAKADNKSASKIKKKEMKLEKKKLELEELMNK